MQAGRLRHRVSIQQRVEARNGYGELISTWSTLATVWGSVEPIRGREFFEAEQVQSEISTRVRIRYYDGITAQMRVLFGSRKLQILAVIDVNERHKEMQLMCKEMTDA